MADQFIQSVEASGTTTAQASITASGVYPLVAFLYDGAVSGTPTVHTVNSDLSGSFLGGASASDGANFVFGQAFTILNPAAGLHTITGTVDTGNPCYLRVGEVQGPAAGAILDTKAQFQSAPGTGVDAVSSTALTFAGASTVIAMSTDSASVSTSDEPTAGTGFTSRANNANSAIGAWRLESGAFAANTAGLFKAITGSHNFITLAVAVLNASGGGGSGTTAVSDLGSHRNRPGRGPYSLGRYFRPAIDAFTRPVQSISDSISEAASGADSLSALLAAPGALTESGAATDAVTSIVTAVATLAEAGSAADAPSAILIAAAAFTESGSATDAPSAASGNDSSLSETGSASDAVSSALTAVAVLSESGAGADVVSALAVLASALSESGSGTDVVTGTVGAQTYNVSVSESGAATGAPSALLAAVASLAETGTAGSVVDGSVGGNTYSVSVIETGAAADALVSVLAAAASISDAASAAEAVSSVLAAVGAVTEFGAATDLVITTWAGLSSLAEVAAAVDRIAADGQLFPGKRIVVLRVRDRIVRLIQ
jgi:hypothetical protein